MMKSTAPDWLNNDCVVTLAQMVYNEHRHACHQLSGDIWGIGLSAKDKTMLLYFKLKRHKVIACSAIINDGILECLPKFSLAYAVLPKYRKRGFGKAVTSVAIIHFKTQVNIKDVSRYYLVSYVSLDNVASQCLSKHFFGPHVKEVCDDHTNERQLEYRMLIEK